MMYEQDFEKSLSATMSFIELVSFLMVDSTGLKQYPGEALLYIYN